jgi:hypothetical protein
MRQVHGIFVQDIHMHDGVVFGLVLHPLMLYFILARLCIFHFRVCVCFGEVVCILDIHTLDGLFVIMRHLELIKAHSKKTRYERYNSDV